MKRLLREQARSGEVLHRNGGFLNFIFVPLHKVSIKLKN